MEATRVRKLEACLSRSTRAVSVRAVIERDGLAYAQDSHGRIKLKQTYPTATVVDEAKAARTAAKHYARSWVQTKTEEVERAVSSATDALAVHQQNEPPGRRKRDVLKPGNNQRWVDWVGRETELKHDVVKAERTLQQWRYSLERDNHEQKVMRSQLNSQQPDLLSTEGGIEKNNDGAVVITDRYPSIAREKAQSVLSQAETHVRSLIKNKQTRLVDDVARATTRLTHHREHEPTDSKLDVILYQGPKAKRDAWAEKLPTLERELQDAKTDLKQWQVSVKDGTYEKEQVWKEFSANAPDASQVNQMVLEAEKKRVEFTGDQRQFYRLEKTLEAKLGRSLKKDVERKRDQLLSKFGRPSYRGRLPKRVLEQAKQHKQSVQKAQVLKRSLSRGLGLGR